jgi:hypothetical protein
MATPNQTDQQRRIIAQTQSDVAALLDVLTRLQARAASYTRLGLADDAILDAKAFDGAGTDIAAYRAAIVSIEEIVALLGQGHGTNLERFAR